MRILSICLIFLIRVRPRDIWHCGYAQWTEQMHKLKQKMLITTLYAGVSLKACAFTHYIRFSHPSWSVTPVAYFILSHRMDLFNLLFSRSSHGSTSLFSYQSQFLKNSGIVLCDDLSDLCQGWELIREKIFDRFAKKQNLTITFWTV